MESILENKVRSRRGYSVAWIRSNILITQECIIVYGGIVEKEKKIKLLEIIALDPNQKERYFIHKIKI
jgi:hypothetical protein